MPDAPASPPEPPADDALDRPRARVARRLAFWAPVTVLTAVAVVQVVRVHTLDQSSWSGAGFGMFATIDNEDSRWVRAVLESDDGSRTVLDVPDELSGLAFDARVVPTASRVAALADRWAEQAEELDLSGARRLRVQVWGVDFEPDPSRLTAHLLEEVTVPVGARR